ncbi:hypothetical protein ANCCAN_12407 [Ancylostoma caninum]|uniref:Uncharacterized protein n=1 Tax=Ancylostoma caninum TaxID=29170 RepID=A0A368GD97_ANCCA|nr:hypothetical protein ANCCAN_12407 [Ancylostoma caninum]
MGESRLVQKKKTIYPEWEKCWDTAVTEGRILQIVLMFNQTPVVEATMRLEHSFLTKVSVSSLVEGVYRLNSERLVHVNMQGSYRASVPYGCVKYVCQGEEVLSNRTPES